MLLLVAFILTSCGNTEVITTEKNVINYTVHSVYSMSDTDNPKFCRYYISTGKDYVTFNDNVFIRDSIGKFSISDTIVLVPMKKSEYRKYIKK